MRFGRIQFDWVNRQPPEPMTFRFFFDPILTRLARYSWLCDHWPLGWPLTPAAEQVLAQVQLPLTPPDTVLPRLARQIIGDRNEFYGVAEPPSDVEEFYRGLYRAHEADTAEWMRYAGGLPVATEAFEQGQQEYLRHVSALGTREDRFLAEAGVDFAFRTNDTVWWVAARDRTALDELASYARRVVGLTFAETVSFGM
jgi:hypothetical protein